MNLAVENLISVSFSVVVGFIVTVALIQLFKKFHHNEEFRILKRKPLFIPAIVFLLILTFIPTQRIGPPPGMESNSIRGVLGFQLEYTFEVYEWDPYLPRVRADYSYHLSREEIIECNVLVYQNDSLIANQTASIVFLGSAYQLSTAHSTFDLEPGTYNLVFTQLVRRADGTPTQYIRSVDLSFSQIQDYTWIEVSIEWDQYRLAIFVVGIALFLLGIYITDHEYDTPEEYERYQRRKNGGRNYPYTRSYRRKMKQNR